jgi:6-phospho-3-hexuloisomerase
MNARKKIEIILEESRSLLNIVRDEHIADLVEKMDRAANIFCFAMGRSGYILRCFSMRLMHLRYPVYFVGETITPKIRSGDLLIILSGSGETGLTHHVTVLAKKEGATIYGVVGSLDSRIGRDVDHVLCLPGGSKTHFPGDIPSIQPAGSLFEQAAFLFFEAIILEIYHQHGGKPEAVLSHHANLE